MKKTHFQHSWDLIHWTLYEGYDSLYPEHHRERDSVAYDIVKEMARKAIQKSRNVVKLSNKKAISKICKKWRFNFGLKWLEMTYALFVLID